MKLNLDKINYITIPNSPNQEPDFLTAKFDYLNNLEIYKNNVSKEEHDEALDKIKNGIKCNREGIVTKLDIILFAKGYPESMNYVNDYLNLFYDNLINNDEEYRETKPNYGMKNERDADVYWDYKRKIERKVLSLLYYDYLVDEDIEKKMKVQKTLGLSNLMYISVLAYHDSIFNKESMDILSTKDRYGDIIKSLIIDYVKENDPLTKKDLDYIIELFNVKKETLMRYLSESGLKYKVEEAERIYINELTEKLDLFYEYFTNGIEYNDQIIPFSYLDYIWLMKKPAKEIYFGLRGTNTSPDFIKKLNCIRKYLNKDHLLDFDYIISPQDLSERNIKYILNGVEYCIDEELSEELLNYFRNNGIPTGLPLMELAAKRKFRGIPILPILELEQQKELPSKVK